MKIELQKIIVLVQEEKSAAIQKLLQCEKEPRDFYIGKLAASDFILWKLELLLNSENEKSSQSSQGHSSNGSNNA